MKKHFYIGQKVLWIVKDFEGRHVTNAVITEVNSDYCLAKSEDDMTLWIDEDTENEFFDIDMVNQISRI